MEKTDKKTEIKALLRIPIGLHNKLMKAKDTSRRSLHSEILVRLEKSLEK